MDPGHQPQLSSFVAKFCLIPGRQVRPDALYSIPIKTIDGETTTLAALRVLQQFSPIKKPPIIRETIDGLLRA